MGTLPPGDSAYMPPLKALVDKNQKYLSLLSISHFVFAGVTALFACFPALYIVIGVMLVNNPHMFDNQASAPIPPHMGMLFIVLGTVFVILGLVTAFAIAVNGWLLRKRRRRTACIVLSAVECLSIPFGTLLGVFTIMLLMKPEIEAQFPT